MKKNALLRIVIWCIVLLALIGAMAALMAEEAYLRDYEPAATEAVPLETMEFVTPVQSLPNEEALSFSADVNEIEIDWVSGDIIITETDADQITISESDVSDARYSLQYQLRGTKLEILFSEGSLMDGFGISLKTEVSKDLYIDIPKNWEGRSIEINAADATVEMHGITLREMDIDGADGTCDFQNCHISDLDIDTASGNVYFSGTLDSLDFDAASASFTGDLQNTPSRIDMDSMDGKLDIALPADCGFTVTMDSINSHLTSDFYSTSMKNGSHIYGDGRCRIDVDGMDCEVILRNLETIVIDPTEETK